MPNVRVLPQLTSALSPPAAPATRLGVAEAPATIASAAVSASSAANDPYLRFIQSPPCLDSRWLDELSPQMLLGYWREAGSPEGWKTPRIRIAVEPLFSMQCSWPGARWKHEPARSGIDSPSMCAKPSPSTMEPTPPAV